MQTSLTYEAIEDSIRQGIHTLSGLTYDDIEGDGLPLRPDVEDYIVDSLLRPGGRALDFSGITGKIGMALFEDGTVEFEFHHGDRKVSYHVVCFGVIWVTRDFGNSAVFVTERLPDDMATAETHVEHIRLWLLGEFEDAEGLP